MKITTNKKLITITSIIYGIIILTYELFYCNFELFHNTSNRYNFSLFRIIVYISIYIMYFIFRKKFIKETVDSFQNKKKRIISYILLFITSIVFFTIIGTIITYKTYYLWQIVTIIAILLLEILIIYITNDIVRNSIVICCTIGIVFSISITVNNQLDEKRHFLAAYRLSLGNFDRSEPTVDLSISKVQRFINVQEFLRYFSEKPTGEITNKYTADESGELPADYYCISYIPSAIGIFLARTLGGSIADIYFAGRIFNLIGYCILIVCCLKILPSKKKIFFTVFFLPMLLCLASIYSVDGIAMGYISIFIAYCLKLYKQKENINTKQILILIMLMILMSISKGTGYIFVFTIVFILPIKNIIKENKKSVFYILLILFMIFFALFIMTYFSQINDYEPSDLKGINTSKQLNYILNNPIEYLDTFFKYSTRFFFNFDNLVFLNAPMFFGKTYYFNFIIILIYIIIVGITDDAFYSFKVKLISLMTFMIVFATTVTALYLAYTPVGAKTIEGYQARYIFPIIPLLLISIQSKKLSSYNKNININLYSAYISSFIIVISIVGSILKIM